MPPQAEEHTPPAKPGPLQDVALYFIVGIAALVAIGSLGGGQLFERYRMFIGNIYAWWDSVRPLFAVFFGLTDIVLLGFVLANLRKTAENRKSFESELSQTPSSALQTQTPHSVSGPGEAQKIWQEIESLSASINPSDLALAILKADAIIEGTLLHLGYEGESFMERLDKVSQAVLPLSDQLRSAHRLRNIIAHDPMAAHTPETIRYAINSYHTALQALGALPRQQ